MNLFLGSLDGGSARRKATTYTEQNNTEKRGHTSMPRAGFKLTIPVFESLKTVRALHRAATGTGLTICIFPKIVMCIYTTDFCFNVRVTLRSRVAGFHGGEDSSRGLLDCDAV